MLRRGAAVFSALSFVVLAGAVIVLIALRPPAPVAPQPPLVGPVSRILVEKAARRMTVYVGAEVARVYAVRLGFAPSGDKRVQGDGRTPEGLFRIDRRNAASAYHLSLGLDYPRPADRARAAAAGVDPGGDIFLHGQPNILPAGVTLGHDWTAGCVALSDAEIEELFAATPIGTEVEIRP
ncbi:MAG: L,D-transpeptidase [Sphingomonadales bacterium]|nr:L,D-transpeptidase [Sphingomonadales bacterium]